MFVSCADTDEDFSFSLKYENNETGVSSIASCEKSWVKESKYYVGNCAVPAVSSAGNWTVEVSGSSRTAADNLESAHRATHVLGRFHWTT